MSPPPGSRKILSVSIHDCEVQTFNVGGAGGQRRDKKATGVRVIHAPSEARGECRESRSQLQNKRTAFLRMIETVKFKLWLRRVTWNLKSPEEIVEKDMLLHNLKIETRETGTWQDEVPVVK